MPACLLRTSAAKVVRGLPLRPAVMGTMAMLIAAGLGGLMLYVLQRRVPMLVALPWALATAFASAGALVTAALMWGTARRWRRPTSELSALLAEIRSGKCPIEELSRVEGGPARLVPVLRGILQDLRQSRAEVAELEQEMRQRVQSRTDALERIIASLRQQAVRDPLTGLYNRRMMQQHLPDIFDRCRQERRALCLLMMDIDNFKLLNDTLGHAAGDELLRAVSQIIRSSIRAEDLAFRCGGDEFVVVLPGTGRQAGERLSQRLRSLVQSLARTLHVDPPPGLSVGVVEITDLADPSTDALLREADRRLYAQKSRHRSQRRLARSA